MTYTVYVVGIGPGGLDGMTIEARDVLAACDCIIGYTTYINLLKPVFTPKEWLSTGMKKEVDRCRLAVAEARKGKTVAMVSSGDAGMYGMAGIMYEVADAYDDVEIKVIAGVTAAASGAARLGAPIVADCCLISLSDLLTPWEKIETRLACAAAGDFVICLYNPASKQRADYTKKAAQIIMRHQDAAIPVGIVRNIGRDGETTELTTLGELGQKSLDMFTTVIIGNSQTKVLHGYMVTPRGYTL